MCARVTRSRCRRQSTPRCSRGESKDAVCSCGRACRSSEITTRQDSSPRFVPAHAIATASVLALLSQLDAELHRASFAELRQPPPASSRFASFIALRPRNCDGGCRLRRASLASSRSNCGNDCDLLRVSRAFSLFVRGIPTRLPSSLRLGASSRFVRGIATATAGFVALR